MILDNSCCEYRPVLSHDRQIEMISADDKRHTSLYYVRDPCHVFIIHDYQRELAMQRTEALETLEFDPQSHPEECEVKKAYRRLALQYHPDKHTTASNSEKTVITQHFKDISEAYQFLTLPLSEQTSSLTEFAKTADELYEDICGKSFDTMKANESESSLFGWCNLFKSARCGENDIKFLVSETFTEGYPPGESGFSHKFRTIDFRGVKHFNNWISEGITPETDSFKILQANIPEEARETIVEILERSPQLKTIEYPPGLFTPEQNRRIGQLLTHSAAMPTMLLK